MKRNIEIIIDGQRADLAQDTSVTLNFNSSLLSDIGQMKTNGSQTISLPMSTTNNRIFDMAMMPSYDSGKTHRYLPCAMHIDGIAIFDNGRCHLLACRNNRYEVAVTWGLMDENESFISDKKKLTELNDYRDDYVTWNANSGVSVLSGGVSQIEHSPSGATASMFYKYYYYGVDVSIVGKDKINISPCVSLLEVWERIRRENELNIELDDFTRQDMERRFIVLVKNKNKALQPYTASLSVQGEPFIIVPYIYNNTDTNRRSIVFGFDGVNSQDLYKDYYFKPFGDGSTDVTLQKFNLYFENSGFMNAVRARPSDYAMEIRYNGVRSEVLPDVDYSNNTLSYSIDRTFTDIKRLEISIKLTRWNGVAEQYWNNINTYKSDFMVWGNNAIINYQKNVKGYPLTQFRLVPNLPDIGQMDFIRFICNWYGLFPMQQGERLKLVSLSTFDDSITDGDAVDWSDKLVSFNADGPQSMEFSLGYAQNNAIGYTTDDIQDVSFITIADKKLDAYGDLMIFPFAASHRNVINQYSVNENGDVVENDIEYRLMGVNENGSLYFNEDMTSSYIVRTKYQVLQEILKKPKTIEEEMTLTLLDLQTLDYSKPIYLSKYGRFFAIDTIQWSSNELTSKVKLIQIR